MCDEKGEVGGGWGRRWPRMILSQLGRYFEDSRATPHHAHPNPRNPLPHQEVFILDHLWCTTQFSARQQLAQQPVIRANLACILGLEDEESDEEDEEEEAGEADGCSGGDDEAQAPQGGRIAGPEDLLARVGVTPEEAAGLEDLDLDGQLVEAEVAMGGLEALNLPHLFPRLRALSLQDLALPASESAVRGLSRVLGGLPELRAVWLNGNPLAEEAGGAAVRSLLEGAGKTGPLELELVNRKLTASYGRWALLYLGGEEPRRLDLFDRGLRRLKAEALEGIASTVEWLDLRRNPLEDYPEAVLPGLRSLPRLRSLRMDLVFQGGEVALESIAADLPNLRWINGHKISRHG